MRRRAWKKSKFQGARASAANRRYTSCRAAIRGGHRLISPRRSDTRTSSVNVFIDARRAKTCSSTVPSRNALAPANAASSTVMPDLQSAPEDDGAGRGQPPGARRDRHAAHALRLPARDRVRHVGVDQIGVELQELAKRRRALLLVEIRDGQVVEREMAREPPRDLAVQDRRPRAARSAQTPDALDGRGDRQAEVPVAPDRHQQRQVAVRDQHVHRELPEICPSTAPRADRPARATPRCRCSWSAGRRGAASRRARAARAGCVK